MFTRLGRLAARHRWPIITFWLALAVVVTAVAPNIDDVAVNDTRAFLATKAPSLEAAEAVDRAFPGRISPSSTVIVVDAGPGARADEGPAWELMRSLDAWFAAPDAPEVVERTVNPVSVDEETAAALLSDDGQVALVLVTFSAGGTEDPTKEALARIGEFVATPPAGVDVYMTGDASIIGAYDEATKNSIDSTTWITILLVVVILLAVYRSPVSPIIPLLTISLAYLISRGVVAFLGEGVMVVSGYTNIFLIVVLFGAGTDYCLFLISRFREEIVGHVAPREAVTETVRTVGETIASSAGTVVVGLSTMALAELGLFNTTGPSVAIGVVVALLAGLTFTPALLSLLGTRAFWPRRTHHADRHRFWNAWARVVTGRPRTALLVTLVVLIPLALYGRGLGNDFDLLQDLPEDMNARQGFHVLSEHLGAGTMQPLNVLVQGDGSYATADGLTELRDLEAGIAGLEGVTSVRGLTSSLDGRGTLSVEQQLADQLAGVREGREALEAAVASGALSAGGDAAAGLDPLVLEQARQGLLDLFSYLQQLGREIPRAAADPGYGEAMAALSSLATTAQSPGASDPTTLPRFLGDLDRLAAGLGRLHTLFDGQDESMLPDTYVATNEGLRSLRDAYLSDDGDSARIQVVLTHGPYTPEALGTVDSLRHLLDREGPAYVEGSSAIVADLRDASNRDMVRAVVFVLLGVFVVLVLLLRAIVAPLYLILTILVSYGATLGIVRLVFDGLFGVSGVTWWVPIFMFVMLVALGMDYNIFLMGRVKEEVARSDHRTGIRTAVARTGGIITSAGIIMAGTFAAMMSASILGLVQVGFAVAVGVLLDTFVVRTALVPSIAVLLGSWSWWPRRPAGAPGDDEGRKGAATLGRADTPDDAPPAVTEPGEGHP